MRFLAFFLSLFIVLGAAAPVSAQGELVKIRLLAERGQVSAGDEIWVGIEKSIAPHWHTYWENAGDSGTALQVTWALPDGFEMGDIQWPAPHKIPYEPLLNYGYEGSAVLLQKLKVPNDLPDGALNFTADIEVLVCKEECIPEYGTYEFALNMPDAMAEDNAAYLSAAATKVPVDVDWTVGFSAGDDQFVLRFPQGELQNLDTSRVEFFPLDWGVVVNPAAPVSGYEDGQLVLRQALGERPIDGLDAVRGTLVYEVEGVREAVSFVASPAENVDVGMGAVDDGSAGVASKLGFIGAVFFALVGGLILNLMPCVFPVLSLKALSLVKISEEHPEVARAHGLAYTLGVVLSFVAIAGALMTLKIAGAEIGWGFQLQNPFIVGLLAYLFLVLGLNLAGVFEIRNPFGNVGGKLARNDGPAGSFFTGILATLVAAPCTAPFMAGAIGFALVQPIYVGLIVFAAIGFGLALPYLALSFVPALQKVMPRPGAWMDVFKQLLAFPMFAAAVWLVWILGVQVGATGMGGLLIGGVLLSFAIWVMQHKPKAAALRALVIFAAVVSLLAAVWFVPRSPQISSGSMLSNSHEAEQFGEVFSQARLEEALAGDAPVFVEMTAAWCITCKVNHAVAVNVDSTKALFADRDVQYLIGDWTNEEPMITRYLEKYGRNGVPLYVYYGDRDAQTGKRPEAAVLPQILTPGTLRDYVEVK